VVDTSKLGEYTITYNVTDDGGIKAAQASRKVTVLDTTSPVLTLKGSATLKIYLGTVYVEAGATAMDSFEGDLTAKMVVGGVLDTSKVGVYTITYDVTDGAGNKAPQMSRKVTVTDLTLDNASIAENGAADAVVGSLTLADVDGATEPVIITEGVGQKIWEFETGDDVYTSPAIGSDGTVYVGSNYFWSSSNAMGRPVTRNGNLQRVKGCNPPPPLDWMAPFMSGHTITRSTRWLARQETRNGNLQRERKYTPLPLSVRMAPFTSGHMTKKSTL
jgi:hypothetical protein